MAVQELAAKKVDIVKIWVDDRDGKYKKLTPDLYGPIIEEAHKRGLRVTAHIFTLDDAKGLLRAGIDAFAHGVRDRDIDEEGLALFKKRPEVVVVPNLPERGVKTDVSWLRESLSEAEFKKLQAGAIDRPELQAPFAIQARNLAKLNTAGVKIALGTDGNTPWSPHLEMADMVASGMTAMQVIVASTRNAAEFLLLGVRGRCPFRDRSARNWLLSDRGRLHSEKPEEVRRVVERVSPAPYLELFARRPAEGWVVWGDEIPRDVFLSAAGLA